jgi:hypothetical protein
LDILKIIKEDVIISSLKNKLISVLEASFDAINRYCQRFHEIKKFYDEDIKFDEDIIRNNERSELFQNWCSRYKREIDIINSIINYQPLGIFLIQLERFKTAALSAPRDKQRVIEVTMPR